MAVNRTLRIGVHCAKTVPESNVFNSFELPLSESRFPDLLETLVVRRKGWSGWSRGLCAQGRRATRLRYAPT